MNDEWTLEISTIQQMEQRILELRQLSHRLTEIFISFEDDCLAIERNIQVEIERLRRLIRERHTGEITW